jgi:hypothetical protein
MDLLISALLVFTRKDGHNRRWGNGKTRAKIEGCLNLLGYFLVQQANWNIHGAGSFALVTTHTPTGKMICAAKMECAFCGQINTQTDENGVIALI